MKVCVVTCGALGKRGIILESTLEEFSKKYGKDIISFSATVIGMTPLLLSMSNVESAYSLAVNGCKKRCSDLVMEKENVSPAKRICLDDFINPEYTGCDEFDSLRDSEADTEAIRKLLLRMEQAMADFKIR